MNLMITSKIHIEPGGFMNNLIKILHDLVKNSFWGEVTIKFKAGKIIVVRKEEQLKID